MQFGTGELGTSTGRTQRVCTSMDVHTPFGHLPPVHEEAHGYERKKEVTSSRAASDQPDSGNPDAHASH
jgi:hypothetical protein